MQVLIKNNESSISALRRDAVPEYVIRDIVGTEQRLEPSDRGMVLPKVTHGKLGLWNIAAECYEIVER